MLLFPQTQLYTVVDAPIEMELDERLLDFKKKLGLELDMAPQVDLKKMDLVKIVIY